MIVVELPDEAATAALATRVAARARVGDVIALKGELGAGKTTFARAFIRARGGSEEVPSPTFTLVQVYEVGDAAIWHFDCYRLRHPEEAWELAIEDAFNEGVSLIEWPERLGPLLPARRLEISICAGATPEGRRATIDPGSDWAARLTGLAPPPGRHPRESGGPVQAVDASGPLDSSPDLIRGSRGNDNQVSVGFNPAASGRPKAIAAFLAASGWSGVVPVGLAGDASFRRYFRLVDGGRRAVLMDAPPPFEDVRPYVAVAAMLRDLGLSAPQIYAEDRVLGFLLIEDFGDGRYTRLLDGAAAGGATAANNEVALYALAIDTLIALHRAVAARGLPALPSYDEERLIAEAALFVEWYAPSVLGSPLAPAPCDDYLARWREILPQAALPARTLVLRDYHADNLMHLPGRPDVRGCGLLDFQDAVLGPASYDLVSLLEDARRDVPPALRAAMTERYFAAFPLIDRALFARSGAILAAQRNSKILGIFTRLWRRDGKPAYLPHIARVWRLLDEDLAREPVLSPIADWLDRHLPRAVRKPPSARLRETGAA